MILFITLPSIQIEADVSSHEDSIPSMMVFIYISLIEFEK